MSEAVVKKYVKAVLSGIKPSEIQDFVSNLSQIAPAFQSEKFKSIISLPTLKSSEKADFIVSLVKDPSINFINFIKLLGANKRLELIPQILVEINKQQAALDNSYKGEVDGNFNFSADQISALEDKFSKRLNASIKLDSQKSEYNGIKIELNDLGVEASFSVDRLKAQMSEHILKAI